MVGAAPAEPVTGIEVDPRAADVRQPHADHGLQVRRLGPDVDRLVGDWGGDFDVVAGGDVGRDLVRIEDGVLEAADRPGRDPHRTAGHPEVLLGLLEALGPRLDDTDADAHEDRRREDGQGDRDDREDRPDAVVPQLGDGESDPGPEANEAAHLTR